MQRSKRERSMRESELKKKIFLLYSSLFLKVLRSFLMAAGIFRALGSPRKLAMSRTASSSRDRRSHQGHQNRPFERRLDFRNVPDHRSRDREHQGKGSPRGSRNARHVLRNTAFLSFFWTGSIGISSFFCFANFRLAFFDEKKGKNC